MDPHNTTQGLGGLASVAIVLAALVAGCADCKTSADCNLGQVCVDGECKSAGTDTDTDMDTDVDTDSDIDSDTDVDTDTDTDIDTDTDTDTDTGTSDTDTWDTGTECVAELGNGDPCEDDCVCLSLHCGDGFCCFEGECCGEEADCDQDSLCTAFYCDGNHECHYSDSPFDCAEEDLQDGSVCTGGDFCDGFGNCVTPSGDCGWYMPTGGMTCAEDSITIDCYTDCTEENEATNCDTEANAGCSDGECLPNTGLDDGEPCAEDFQCDSGHCGDGFCCGSGECCSATADCDDSQCNLRLCDTSFQCQYTPLYCGAEDTTDGDLCTGGDLCDGVGNCVAPYPCDGAYAWDGTYTCSDLSVSEDCYTSCVNDVQCNFAYECEDDVCVEVQLPNGSPCTEDGQCESEHCGDGFCCPAGECCSVVGDCDDTLCNTPTCPGPNYQCLYAGTACAVEDTTYGDTCTGDNLCDGFGNCVVVSECTGPYAWDGYYQCTLSSVSETCYSSCTNFLHCNEGYTCVDNECVAEIVPDGGPCVDDGDCESGHCEGGICCPAGECCNDVTDCDDSLCVLRYCDGNHQCDYYDVIPCGTPDLGDGDTCMGGDALCDGAGDCDYDVDNCTGAYAWTGNYSCGPAEVSEECFTTCSDDFQCNDGYYCEGGACVGLIPEGGEVCSENAECETGYCTTTTGVCCYEGWCCNDDGDCGAFDCDLTTWSCEFSCDVGFGDDDSLCTDLGDFHCDNGQCYEDLFNGESYCDEDSDCLSNHCDTTSAICCDSGPCCQDDLDCDGFICDASFNCVTDCSPLAVEDDTLCAAGYHCDGSSCLADIINGLGLCDEDSDCVSGNCTESTGICCSVAPGDCCNSPSQCNDGNQCTTDYCMGTFHCNAVSKADGEQCSDGTYCNGMERCQAGICQAGTPPCDGLGNFCLEVTCNEGDMDCDETPQNEGLACTEVLWCLGDVAKVCNSGGMCMDPGTGTPPCTGSTSNDCTNYWCNEETDNCDEVSVSDGLSCDDSDPCTGDADECQDGSCEGTVNPCADGDSCTTDNCTDGGGFPVCGTHDAKSDYDLCDLIDVNVCFGDDPYCFGGNCIPGPTRPCYENDLCTLDLCSEISEAPYCEVEANTGVTVTCGATTPVDGEYFEGTYEYYTYSGACTGSYPGPEALLVFDVPTGGDVTATVSAVVPAGNVEVLYLADECDAITCVAHGTNSVTYNMTAGTQYLVLEAPEGLPPTSMDVTLTCP